MSARTISYFAASCDGCGRDYDGACRDDETEYRAELRAIREGGWKRDGGDCVCPGCASLSPSERPNWLNQFRRGRKGVGV